MSDIIEKIGGSTIQHGPGSQRVYLMKLDPADLPGLTVKLDELVTSNGYTKIFAKIPSLYERIFTTHGYRVEGRIPKFYNGQTDAIFLGRYTRQERSVEAQQNELNDIVALAESKREKGVCHSLPEGYRLRPAIESDAPALASLYRTVFASYPFPIHDSAYILETMQSHVCYFIAEKNSEIAGAASAEIDHDGSNAEMTDFATLPVHLGNGLALHLLREMELAMSRKGIITLFTIARSFSHGMNITFAKCGYEFGGMLTNNTQIAGKIESMNIWYKSLSTHRGRRS